MPAVGTTWVAANLGQTKKGGSQGVGTILRVRWRTDEHRRNGCGLQPRTEVAASEWQDVSEDRRHVRLSETDRQPGLANAGLVRCRKGQGRV
jgi:hypothetical protein